jgi:uncharacterized OB-fold protein
MTMSFPTPERTPLNEPYWSGLAEGALRFQRCDHCGHAWLPPRAECPSCLRAQWFWQPSSGRARLVSWVVYHIAYHDHFADKLPYNVAVVELEEGPRLITNIVDAGNLAIDQPLVLTIEREDGVALARFRPA